MNQHTVIFDANCLHAQSWFAALSASKSDFEMQGADGNPDMAAVRKLCVHIAAKKIVSLIRPNGKIRPQPTHALMCWDGKAKSDKQREQKDPSYYLAMMDIKNLAESGFGITNFSSSGEADDAVASAAFKAESSGRLVTVISLDKDVQQCMNDKVRYFSLKTNEFIDPEDAVKKWNVKRPIQIALALAIQGDSTDKIGGVRGLGPKKAAAVLESIDDSMGIVDAISAVESNFNDQQLFEFREALNLTLLDIEVDTPDPTPIQFNEDAIPDEYQDVKKSLALLAMDQ